MFSWRGDKLATTTDPRPAITPGPAPVAVHTAPPPRPLPASVPGALMLILLLGFLGLVSYAAPLAFPLSNSLRAVTWMVPAATATTLAAVATVYIRWIRRYPTLQFLRAISLIQGSWQRPSSRRAVRRLPRQTPSERNDDHAYNTRPGDAHTHP